MKQLVGNGFKGRKLSLGLASRCVPHLRPPLPPPRDTFHLPTALCTGIAAAGTRGALPGSNKGFRAHTQRLAGTRHQVGGQGDRQLSLSPPSSLLRQDQDQSWLPVSPEAGKHPCQDQDMETLFGLSLHRWERG